MNVTGYCVATVKLFVYDTRFSVCSQLHANGSLLYRLKTLMPTCTICIQMQRNTSPYMFARERKPVQNHLTFSVFFCILSRTGAGGRYLGYDPLVGYCNKKADNIMTYTPSPSPTDLYHIEALLTEEERMVSDTVRKFVTERVLPIIGKHFEAGTFPRELVPEMAELGLLGMHLDGYGCAGMSAVCYGLACQELEAGDSGVRSFVSVQGSLTMFPIWAFGSEVQK